MVNEIVEIVAFLIIFLERIYGFIKWRIENNNDVSPMDRRQNYNFMFTQFKVNNNVKCEMNI